MLNSNAFKTSLIFLGIILVVVTLRMFLMGDGIFVKSDGHTNVANIVCIFKESC